MARKWIKTSYPGVRYREHPSRRHGVRPDRYFSIRYKLDGKDKEEGLGWSSEGVTASIAAEKLAKLREAARTGQGAVTLAEQRKQAEERRRVEAEAEAEAAREKITLTDIWPGYLELALATKKTQSVRREKELWTLWIAPVVGSKSLGQVSPLDLERLKKRMADAGRSPRSVQYALAVTRQLFNHARKAGLYAGDPPTRQVSKVQVVNQRVRFLSVEEVERLLSALAKLSQDVHDQALLSLYGGFRWGEVAGLTWGNVDFDSNTVHLLDTKHGQRSVPMTISVRAMLARRRENSEKGLEELVFPSKVGSTSQQVSQSFMKSVTALGLNDGVKDRRQRVTFHTLRHTFASWLVMRGQPLYTVAKLLGHSTLAMTERYSHLAPDHVRGAVAALEGVGTGGDVHETI